MLQCRLKVKCKICDCQVKCAVNIPILKMARDKVKSLCAKLHRFLDSVQKVTYRQILKKYPGEYYLIVLILRQDWKLKKNVYV